MRVTTQPREAQCPACGSPTVAAWRDGLYEAVHVDPVNLTTLGELQAVTSGRRTFHHWGGPSGGLDQRGAEQITRHPAGDPANPVRPEHQCGADPPDHLPDRKSAVHDFPPF
jgi:hypothetical protein